MSRICRISPVLAESLATSLRESGVVQSESARGLVLFSGIYQGGRIQVKQDGTVTHEGTNESSAFVSQLVRGLLPRARGRFLLGVDEAGIGGEGQPTIGMTVIPSEVRADLIALGVRDSKAVSTDSELGKLVEYVHHHAVMVKSAVIGLPSKGASNATHVARGVAQMINELYEEGSLSEKLYITIDQTDEAELKRSLGAVYDVIQDRMQIMRQAEACPEVAAASLIAKAESRRATGGQRGHKSHEINLTGTFSVRPANDSDKEQVLQEIEKLELSYPAIREWVGRADGTARLWERILVGKYRCTVAKAGIDLAGFALSQQKDERNVKMSTFVVLPRFRSKKIGERLMRNELDHWMDIGIRRLFVTFANEQFENMEPFFRRYGFTVDGISPQRYRDNAYEVIMGKRFHNGSLRAEGFPTFVEHYVFRVAGHEIESLDETRFIARPRHTLFSVLPVAREDRFFVHCTIQSDVEATLDSLRSEAKQHGARPVLASLYGWPADRPLPQDVTLLDAYELERLFYPLHVDQTEAEDIVIPIQSAFVRRLFPNPMQTTLGPVARGLRTDNVYYRVAHGGSDLRRGARLFFYESGGAGIQGVGRLQWIDKGSARKLFGKHGGQGAWNLREIEEHLGSKQGLVYLFDWFRRFETPVPMERIKEVVPKFNPQTVYKIPHSAGDELTRLGGIYP